MEFARNGSRKELASRRTYRSYRTVTKAFRYYEEGQYERALENLFKCDEVEPIAMFLLGIMYTEGQGVIKNMRKSAQYLVNLVEYEDIRDEELNLVSLSQYMLGDMFYTGIALEKDDAKALKHWKTGATMEKNERTGDYHVGTVKCQIALAMFYSDPQFNKEKKALYWYKRAADAGSIISEGALGVMYLYGIGTEKDNNLAYSHLARATAMENAYGKGYLVKYYYDKKLYHRAISLANELNELIDLESLSRQKEMDLKYIKQGIAVGVFYLSKCIEKGYAAKKNIPLAESLLKKALDLSTDVVYNLQIETFIE